MVVNDLEITNVKPDNPAHRDTALVTLLQKQGATFVAMDIVRVDGIPQVAMFTPDGHQNSSPSVRFGWQLRRMMRSGMPLRLDGK